MAPNPDKRLFLDQMIYQHLDGYFQQMGLADEMNMSTASARQPDTSPRVLLRHLILERNLRKHNRSRHRRVQSRIREPEAPARPRGGSVALAT
jgi:hypothetical protein